MYKTQCISLKPDVYTCTGDDMSLWVPGSSRIRDVKSTLRDKVAAPSWQMGLVAGTTICSDEDSLDQLEIIDGLQIIKLDLLTYDNFYNGDLHISYSTATLASHFTLLPDSRQQDILETLSVDSRIRTTDGG